MFQLDTNTMRIRMHQGDTRTVTYRFAGYTFGNSDRVVWTMKSRSGNSQLQKVITPSNGAAAVTFANGDTKNLPAGEYRYDIRIVINPSYTSTTITGGDTIYTEGPFELQLIEAVGKI